MRYIFQGVGLLFSLLSSFLGLMYWLNGDIITSGLVSSLLTVFQYFIVEVLSKRKQEITKYRLSSKSIILWIMYAVISVPLSLFLLHSLNVEVNEKLHIQQMGNKMISDLIEQRKVYLEAKDNYLNDMNVSLRHKMFVVIDTSSQAGKLARKYLLDTVGISQQMLEHLNYDNISQDVISFLEAKDALLKKVSDSIEVTNKNFVARYGSVFDSWSRLQINLAFIEADTLLYKNHLQFKHSFETYARPTHHKYAYEWNSEKPLLNNPIKLWRKNRPYILFISLLLFHLLILAPFLMQKTPGRYPPSGKKPKGGRVLSPNI